MFLISSIRPTADDSQDPVIMRRRELLAAALGLGSALALPTWAEAAARTSDMDHTRRTGTWYESYSAAREELNTLGRLYVTAPGVAQHADIRDSSLWLYAQTTELADAAPLALRRDAHRLCSEAAMFAAGCYVDFGQMKAATDLYSAAHNAAGLANPDLRAFIACQANWVPMYSGRWDSVLRRSESAVTAAERHGGSALLMAYVHRAHAHTMYGNKDAARADLARAKANIARVSTSADPHSALHYSATKVHFSSATVYAALGDAPHHADSRERALADPTLGWIDSQLLRIGTAVLEPDTERAAHDIRLQLVAIPDGGYAHCVKADAEKALGRLKARQLTSRDRTAGPEVRALSTYLSQRKVA